MIKYIIIASVLMLGACAVKHNPDAGNLVAYKWKTDQVEKTIENIPEWYTTLPEKDNTVYSVGSSLMPDLQTAVDLAKLSAKEQLADRIYSKLRSQTKTFNAKAGIDVNPMMIMEMEKATKSIIADAEVNGYKTEKVDVQQAGASYRAYVLLAYNHQDAQKVIENRILTMNLKKSNKNDAWDELDNVVEDIKMADEESE